MKQINLSLTKRGRLGDIPGLGKCAVAGCANEAHHAVTIWAEDVNLSAVRSGATDWGGAGTRGYLCQDHVNLADEEEQPESDADHLAALHDDTDW